MIWGKKTSAMFPWTDQVRIFEWIEANPHETMQLPDDPYENEKAARLGGKALENRIAGAADVVNQGRLLSTSERAAIVADITRKMTAQIRKPSDKTRRDTYLAIMDVDLLQLIDELMSTMVHMDAIDGDVIYQEALWFAKQGAHRNVVKFGIALLGLLGTTEQKPVLMTLGRHEEFSLYVAVSLRNSQKDANQCIFELAKELRAWGKIQLVLRLRPENEEIRDWLIREGCRNDVLNEYLAFSCANKGRLLQTLQSESLDSGLYHGAGVIIESLIKALQVGGVFKAETIDDYSDAAMAVAQFLKQSAEHASTLNDFDVIRVIWKFLKEEDAEWVRRYNDGKTGWSHELREACLNISKALMIQDHWMTKITAPIDASDRTGMHNQFQAADTLGIDLFPQVITAIAEQPTNGLLYFHAFNVSKGELARVKQIIATAEAKMPLKQMALGPALEVGQSEAFQGHQTLSSLLTVVKQLPGTGLKLIGTALYSPVVSTRLHAIDVLRTWPRDQWESLFMDLLQDVIRREPAEEIQQQINELISVSAKS